MVVIYVEMFRSDGAQQVRIQRTLENTRRDVEKLRGFYTSPNKLIFCNPSDDDETDDEDYAVSDERRKRRSRQAATAAAAKG